MTAMHSTVCPASALDNVLALGLAIPKSMYARLKLAFPHLADGSRRSRLFCYLVWGPRDLKTRNVPMSRVMLNRVYRADSTAGDNNNLDVVKDLWDLEQATGMIIRYSSYDRYGKIAREVYHVQLPPNLAEFLYGHRAALWRDGLVNILTGEPISHDQIKAYHQRLLEEANERNLGCPEQEFLKYMNGLKIGQFRLKAENIAACDDWVHELYTRWVTAKKTESDKVAASYHKEFDYAKGALERILRYPLTIYQKSDRSPRLFGRGGWPTLHRQLRWRLLPDLCELDLTSAHLAIFAKLGNVASVITFLETGRSVWPYLCEQLGIPYSDDVKTALKILIYEILFGCLKHRLFFPKGKLTWALLRPFTKEVQARFVALPLIQDLFEARTRLFTQIKSEGGMSEAYGKWIATQKGTRKKEGVVAVRGVDAKSVLSQVCQSYEMRLLESIRQLTLDEGRRANGWDVLIWQHDGCSIRIKHPKKDAKRIIQRLTEAVNAEAASMDILTKLEVKFARDLK